MAGYPNIPPIGASPSGSNELVTYIEKLAEESRGTRDAEAQDWDLSLNYFEYGGPDRDDTAKRVNLVQNSVIAFVDVQTKEPVTISLEPATSGEPAMYFNPANGQQLDQQTGEMAKQLAAQGLASLDSIIEVSGDTVAEFWQSIFDYHWSKCRADAFLRENLYYTNIFGMQCGLYEWDDDKKTHLLTNVPNKQVFIDPTVSTIDRAHYVIFDQIMSADQAKSIYPDLADEISAAGEEGAVSTLGGASTYSSVYTNVNFGRDMVVLRTAWIRYQLTDMSPEEAVARQLVEVRKIPTGNMLASTDEMGMPMQVQETREVYFLPDGVAPVEPGAEGWPTRTAIRQTTIIADQQVDDRECEFWDVPVLHNRNIPKPHTPFGQSEPYRLRGIQDTVNETNTNLTEHTKWFKGPMTVAPLSAKENLPEEYKDGFARPNMIFWVPDELYNAPRKPVETIDPPPISPGQIQAKQEARRDFTDVSGFAEVMQGQANNQSGKAIAQLQDAATSIVGFKSQYFQEFVYRLARMMLHSIVWRLKPEDLYRINSKYPLPVVAEFQRRGQLQEWNIIVEAVSGAAMVKEMKRQTAMQLYAAGLLDAETTLDRMGEDSKLVMGRLRINSQNAGAAVAPANNGPQQLNGSQGQAAPAQ